MRWKKKADVKKVERPAIQPSVQPSVPPAAKPTPVKPVVRPAVKTADVVMIHMMGNAMIGDVQYVAGKEYKVSMSNYRAIGTSCVSMAMWRAIQEKGMQALKK